MNFADIAADIGGSGALANAAGQAGVDPTQAQSILHGALEHLDGGGDPAAMAEAVVAKTGIDPSVVQQFLPCISGLLQGHAANAAPQAQGLLGSLLSAF